MFILSCMASNNTALEVFVDFIESAGGRPFMCPKNLIFFKCCDTKKKVSKNETLSNNFILFYSFIYLFYLFFSKKKILLNKK